MFCSFARLEPGKPGAYTMSHDEAWGMLRARVAADDPITEIHIVNGLHPGLPFENGELDGTRLDRLAALEPLSPSLGALLPTPVGEPYGLDALRFFALARLALPAVPRLFADVTTLGPRLAQMAFGFGADELFGPIVAERALRLGANANNPALTRKEAATLIRGAGLLPCERLADGTLEEVTPA